MAKSKYDHIDFIQERKKYSSNRKMAEALGIDESVIRRRLKKNSAPKYRIIDTDLKVLIFDIETTDMEIVARSYGLKNYIKYFNPDKIKRDWTMLGAAWKWKGENIAQVVSVMPNDPLNDEGIVRALYAVLKEADVIIGHNSDRFDIKKFNARAISYGLPPIGKKIKIDTLKMVKKYFAFTSNKLSYIAKYLNVDDEKDKSPNWEKCIRGCPDELRYMRKYNKKDVFVTEQVYDKLVSYDENHPRIANVKRDIDGFVVENTCPACGSADTVKDKPIYTQSGKTKTHSYTCNNCGSNFKGERIKL